MRAKMSDRDTRRAYGYSGPLIGPPQAEREARAIMAETEPAAEGPDAYARASWGWRGVYCLPGSMASALAASLAAFCAAEDPEAYLREGGYRG